MSHRAISDSLLHFERPTKVCTDCKHELTHEFFPRGSKICESCKDARRINTPWTHEDVERLKTAAKAILSLWPMLGGLDEAEQQKYRDLINALDRRTAWTED
jgi:hypothetical protein